MALAALFVWWTAGAVAGGGAPGGAAGEDAPAAAESASPEASSPPQEDGAHDEAAAHGEDDGEHGGGGHEDPFAPILLELSAILLAALVGRWAAAKVDQPSVLGELVMGVILGNVLYALQHPFGIIVMHLDAVTEISREIWHRGATVASTTVEVVGDESGELVTQIIDILSGPQGSLWIMLTLAVWIFSNLGVILLLFVVGLESSIDEMKQVGWSSLWVAIIGIVAPYFLGYYSSLWLLPDRPSSVHIFIGATLCATSVGITARVFKDLRKLQTDEAKVILGAAVIDDVLGLIILAVVVGIIATGDVNLLEVGRIALLSFVFLGGMVILGDVIAKQTGRLVGALDRNQGKLLLPLTLAFILSWVAASIELASIVGAFAAGLILSDEHFQAYSEMKLHQLVGPVEAIFAPVFFVLMGMQVNLATFGELQTLGLAGALTIAAIIGKMVSGLPAIGLDRISVGIGMVPRGEVGLIFASIGKALGVVTDATFSAVVIMVIVTTLITPIGLKWSLARGSGPAETEEVAEEALPGVVDGDVPDP